MSLLSVAASALILIGLHSTLARTDPVKRILAANILGSGVFILLLTLCRDADGRVDPVPQAMVLTGILVSFSATALALVFVRLLEADSLSDGEDD